MPTLNVSTAHFGKVSWMPTSLKILCKYRYSQKSGYRTTTTKDHMNHWEEKHQWNTMPCRRHVINRSTLKKIDLLITTIFKFENSPGCQSENREGYNLFYRNLTLPIPLLIIVIYSCFFCLKKHFIEITKKLELNY